MCCRINTMTDKLQGTECMLHSFVMLVQLRQDGTDVEMRARYSDIVSLQ